MLLKSVQILLNFLLNKNQLAVIFILTKNMLLEICILVDVLLILKAVKDRGVELWILTTLLKGFFPYIRFHNKKNPQYCTVLTYIHKSRQQDPLRCAVLLTHRVRTVDVWRARLLSWTVLQIFSDNTWNWMRYDKLLSVDRTVPNDSADSARSPFKWTLWVASYCRMVWILNCKGRSSKQCCPDIWYCRGIYLLEGLSSTTKPFGKDSRFSSRGMEHETAIVPTWLQRPLFNILL